MVAPSEQDNKPSEFLRNLEDAVRAGGKNAQSAFGKLSSYAFGGNPQARQMVEGLDKDIMEGRLSLPPIDIQTKVSKDSTLGNIVFALVHPVKAWRTKMRQIGVAMELEMSPPTSDIETFPNLSLRDAASKLEAAKPGKRPSSSIQPPDRDPGIF